MDKRELFVQLNLPEAKKFRRGDHAAQANAADAVVITLENPARVLLIKRRNWPYQGFWALPGGFREVGSKPDKSLEATCRRELEEEAGLHAERLLRLPVRDAIDRDPRALIPEEKNRLVVVSHPFLHLTPVAAPVSGRDDAVEAEWFPLTETRRMTLAFDHSDIIFDAVVQIRDIFAKIPPLFDPEAPMLTSTIRAIYETFFSVSFDKRNESRELDEASLLDEKTEKP